MTEILEKIKNSGLSPNQFFLLYAMTKGITAAVSTESDIKVLEDGGFIKNGDVINDIFTDPEGPGFHMRCVNYVRYFPPIVLPSGIHARGKMTPVKVKLKAFIKAYPYDWDLIYTATEKYVVRQAHDGYRFMQTASSFIFDKNGDSTLALECDTVEYMNQTEKSI